jgi:hydrogenase/urease accessory protein HupE
MASFMAMASLSVKVLAPLVVFVLVVNAAGHAVPDVPVRGYFESDGTGRIEIEVDTRCFSDDPTGEPYLVKRTLDLMTEEEREELREEARELIRKTIAFYFEPLGRVAPEFEFEFTSHGRAVLADSEDPVMVTGEWKTTLPAGLQGYRIEALPAGELSVVFQNELDGQTVERFQVLFPGENSYLLNLTRFTAGAPTEAVPGSVGVKADAGDWWAVFVEFLRQGYVHVIPQGLDHILFVLGVFLLSRKWRPLLWQVTMFTLAHTLTLGLATLGWVHIPASIVEPLIAGSIAVIALENIFMPKYTPWRLVVVFLFGLIHGLGFAGALSELDLPPTALLVGLVGFNIGVEGGQLTVIAVALLATIWVRDPKVYRRYVVIPGSLAIAVMGIYWMVERVMY